MNRNAYKVLTEKPVSKRHLNDLDIDERTVLKLVLKKMVGRV
jgi:hypothetical protein